MGAQTRAAWKMSMVCMFRGGSAVGEARRDPATRTNMIGNKLPENQSTAELPSAFLVTSTASSSATGSSVTLALPITPVITNSAAVLFLCPYKTQPPGTDDGGDKLGGESESVREDAVEEGCCEPRGNDTCQEENAAE